MSSPKVRSLGSWFFEKKSHAEDRPKNCKHSILVSGLFQSFVGVGILIINHTIKNPNGIFELVFPFFFPLFDSLKAEWDGFYRKMKELSKVSREVPAERPRCLRGGWAVFFWGVPGS